MRTEVYWIDGPWAGRVAIMPRPRGGDWLEDEVRAWRLAGIGVIVSLLEGDEIAELDLDAEPTLCEANGIHFLAFPIADRGVPSSVPETLEFAQQLETYLTKGKNIAVHCRQGVGRSALLIATLLSRSGIPADIAFERIGQSRRSRVPDTAEQRTWVERFVRSTRASVEH